MLTVWRRVHIETDAMPPVSGNFIDAKIVPLPPGHRGITISPGETKEIHVYDTMNPGGFLEEGQLENGLLIFENHALPITTNTHAVITVTNNEIQKVVISNPTRLFLYDDDDFNNNNGANLTGDNGEAIPLPDTFMIPEGTAGDARLSNVLALAYIRPVYYNANTRGNGMAQQFKVNVNVNEQDEVESIISFDNRTSPTYQGTDQDEYFWTVYLLNAYQPAVGIDWDPRTEVLIDELPDVSRTFGGLASFVFVEPGGLKECSNNQPMFVCNISTITAREVARALGGVPEDGGLLRLESNVLSADSLRKIRAQPFP